MRVRDAGHILGSSSVEVWVDRRRETRRKLVFSGDLGQYGTPILHDPWRFESADLVLMESTYGDRRHRGRDDTERELGAILAQAARDGGNVIVPAFAIGRSQELLYLLAKHYGEWHLARWKIFLDSPMAIAASKVYWHHPDRFDEEAVAPARKLSAALPPLPNLTLSETADESRAINNVRGGAIIIAGSGMANGGRILHHLKHNLRAARMPRAHRRLPGAGHARPPARRSRARSAHPRPDACACAAQVHTLGGLSAHGDQADLLRWYDSFTPRPPVYLVHGEVPAGRSAGR